MLEAEPPPETIPNAAGPPPSPLRGLTMLPQQGCWINLPGPPPLTSSTEVKALWEAKLQTRGGHFKITYRSSLKTSLSWQIKETQGLHCAQIFKKHLTVFGI